MSTTWENGSVVVIYSQDQKGVETIVNKGEKKKKV